MSNLIEPEVEHFDQQPKPKPKERSHNRAGAESMSTDQNTTETTEAAQAGAEQPQDALPEAQDTEPGTEVQDAQQEAQNPNAEAKKYRLRLRETEAELETAQQRVSQLQRTLAEAALENHLSQPSDLWEIGQQDAASFYDDDGDLDRDRLTEAARALAQDRPGLQPQRGPYVQKIADAPRHQNPDRFREAFKPSFQR